jgi:hypothetical protein
MNPLTNCLQADGPGFMGSPFTGTRP